MTSKFRKKSIRITLNDMITKYKNFPMNDLFERLLPSLESLKEKNDDYATCLLYIYLFYLKDFISMIQQITPHKYKDILLNLASLLNYEKHQENRIIIHFGDKPDKFYLILKGKVDVLLPREKHTTLYEVDYLRYLAYLIGYKEYEMLNRVINSNSDNYPLSITDASKFGKITKSINKGVTVNSIQINDLYKILSIEEQARFKEAFEINLNQINQNISIKEEEMTTQEYIKRIMNFELVRKDTFGEWSNEKKMKFIIYEYFHITSLVTGQLFGEVALGDPITKRGATIITSDHCHLAALNKESYDLSLKEVNEQIRRDNFNHIITSFIFKTVSPIMIQKKYFIYFVSNKMLKGSKILIQNETSDDILFLRKGLFEISAYLSFEKLTSLINRLFSILMKDKIKYSKKDYELVQQISEMNKVNKRIEEQAKDIKSMEHFYKHVENNVISSLSAPDIIGFKDLCDDDDKNIYTFEQKSQEGDCLKINKKIFTQISYQEPEIMKQEKKYIKIKLKKMLIRLLSVRTSKIEIYFSHHPDYIYFQEFSSKKKINLFKDVLQLSNSPKEKKPKSLFSCFTSKKHLKCNSSVSLPVCITKAAEKIKKTEESPTSKFLKFKNLGKIKTLLNKKKILNVKAINKIHNSLWKTRNKTFQTYYSQQSLRNSSSVTLMKGNSLYNNENTSHIRPLQNNYSKRKCLLKYLIKANSALVINEKSMFPFNQQDSLDNENLKSNHENKQQVPINHLSCPSIDYSIPVFKARSLSIFEHTQLKKNRYIENSQKSNIKRTRNIVLRFQSQFSCGKRKIKNSKEKDIVL